MTGLAVESDGANQTSAASVFVSHMGICMFV